MITATFTTGAVNHRFGIEPVEIRYPLKRDGRWYYAEGGYALRWLPSGCWGLYLGDRLMKYVSEDILNCFDWRTHPVDDTSEGYDIVEQEEAEVEKCVQWINSGWITQPEIDELNEVIEGIYLPRLLSAAEMMDL
jgi:hypothetical protein